jgi:N6-adenosine-specific RNA methylase IME4
VSAAAPLDLFGHPEPVVDFESRPPTEESHVTANLGELIAAGKTFGVILADPPWTFKTYSDKGKDRSPERHYRTMSLDAIKALPVQQLAAPNCALFLWATIPMLANAIDVIRCWGFKYKTAGFVWIKLNPSGKGLATGTGFWSRANAEICLLAAKGAPKRRAKNIHQVVIAPRREHSRKPEEVPERIECLVGGPFLELFARRQRRGWTVFGDEIPPVECGVVR